MATREGVDRLLDLCAEQRDLLATIRDQAEDELRQHPENEFAAYLAIVLPTQRLP